MQIQPYVEHSTAFCHATPAPLLNFLSHFSSSAGGDVDEERLSGERFGERLMNVVNIFHISCTCGNRTWICLKSCRNRTWIYFKSCRNWTWIYFKSCGNRTWIYFKSCGNRTWIYFKLCTVKIEHLNIFQILSWYLVKIWIYNVYYMYMYIIHIWNPVDMKPRP